MRPYAHRSAVSGHYSGLDGLSAKEHGLLMRDTRCVTSTFGTLTERRTPTAIRTLLPKPICVYGRERVLFRVEEMLLHRYQEATGLCSSTRKVAGSAPKWRRSPSERSSSTVWASPPPWSSTLPSTSHTKNTERIDSPRRPL